MNADPLGVEELLGWLPMPAPPAPLVEQIQRTETLTVQWWSGGGSDVLEALIETWAAVFSHATFDLAPLPFRLTCHDRAALAWCWRAVSRHRVADLDEAAAHIAIVAAHDPPWTDDLCYHQGIYHYSAAAMRHSTVDVDRATAILRDLVYRLPATDTRLRPRCLDVLGRVLLEDDRFGADARSEETIALLTDALAGISPTAPYRGLIAVNLSIAFGRRFKATGRLADVDAAIAVLEANPPVQAYADAIAMHASRLGILYGRRCRLRPDTDDLRRSLEWHERAVECAPVGSESRPAVLTNYGNALLWAYERTLDMELVDCALRTQEQAVELTDPDHRLYASRLNNLGNTLSTAYRLGGRRANLDRAIELYERAIALTPADDTDLPSRHYNLANCLYQRHVDAGRRRIHLGQRRNRLAAVSHYRAACRLGLDREPEWTLGAARQWGDWASARSDWLEATEPYGFAVDAVDRLFANQATRSHKETWLRTADGLSARAGYALFRAGRAVDAVLIQERGRARLLAEALRRDDTDPHPGGRPLDAAALYAAAGSAPLVYLDATDLGGVALVVDPAERAVRGVPLPGLRDAAVHVRSDLLRGAHHGRRVDPGGWLGAVDAVGRWAYDEVLGPLLDCLPGVARVTLVPVGRLSALPLHAAWEPDPALPGQRRYAVDRVAISYVPTVRALAVARDDLTPPRGTALVVDEPAPVTAPALPLSRIERAAITAVHHDDRVRVLEGMAATRTAVLAEFGRNELMHLSCHGLGRPESPLDSGLLMAGDELLTLRDLYEVPPRPGVLRPRLVMLSACETNQPGTDLPDEVVSLPTGLLQAGCRGVIATQWAVSSLTAALIATRFYREWAVGTSCGAAGVEPGVALTAAQRWLREVTNEELAGLSRPAPDGRGLSLPAEVTRPLWIAARRRPPAERRFAHPAHWAAFAHVGV